MRTIRGKLGGGGRIGWFAFQDIIMSVTGILIVISLVLALQIDRVWDPSTQAGLSDDTDPAHADVDKLASLMDQVGELREELEMARAGMRAKDSPDATAAELVRLEEAIGRAKIRLSGFSVSSSNEEMTEADMAKLVEVARLDQELMEVESELKEVRMLAEEMPHLPDLERLVRESEARVVQSRKESTKLRLIPEDSDTTKEPLIIVLGRAELKLMRFDEPGEREFKSLHDLTLAMKGYRKVDQYFVIFVRPSGTGRFGDVLQAIKNGGFEVGYDAVAEDVEISLGRRNGP